MRFLLSLSRFIDGVNDRVGRLAYWLILITVVISAGNALSRYGFNLSSNAWLEIQWYLFSAMFLLMAGYVLLKNAHVRIDAVASHLSRRTTAWIEIFGILFFLIPTCWIFLDFGWAMFQESYVGKEVSTDAGGLIRWPVKILVPIGFLLLLAQAVSELIKRVAFFKGLADWDPYGTEKPVEIEPSSD